MQIFQQANIIYFTSYDCILLSIVKYRAIPTPIQNSLTNAQIPQSNNNLDT